MFSLLSVEKGLGEGVVSDLERSDLFVLVSGDSDESGHREGLGFHEFLRASGSADFDDVNSWLVFVKRVEHDLLSIVLIELVRQLDF